MPPHLHRRPPLRQRLPAPRRILLLPPHHPKASHQPAPASKPPRHVRPAAPRGPLRHPGLHRRSPAAHRLERNRPPPRRPSPLRPPDRQPKPTQSPTHRRTRNRRRDHHRPRTRYPRPTRRGGLSSRTPQRRRRHDHEPPAGRRNHQPDTGNKHSAHPQRRSCPVPHTSSQIRLQKVSSSNQTKAVNRKIHPPLLSFLHRWPPRPNPPAPPP
jgi:hypothetical protein